MTARLASRAGLAAAVLAVLAHTAPARSQPTPQASETSQADLEEAKRLFREGNELRKAGDCQRALESYLRSRQLVPSVPNTINAAYCMDQVGRYDEALELYEELSTRFTSELAPADREAIGPAMSALRRRIGSVDVSANVEGILVIDGRMRGRLPLLSAVRVLAGKHTIRVIKDGFETFESSVTVAAGQTVPVDAKLKPLTNAGRLRIAADGLDGSDLYIDGAKVGELPWEGTLAPGPHLYSVRKGTMGSAPRLATVVEGQTVSAPVEVSPLGLEVRIVAEPPTAQLTIDGVAVGTGRWQGALPQGEHTVEARELGYLPAKARIPAAGGGEIVVRLRIDRAHPRWAVAAEAWTFWLEGFGGFAFTPSLGSDAEADCGEGACTEEGLATGAMLGLRAGYRAPIGLSVEVTGGYAFLGKELTRELADPGVGAQYVVRDDIGFAGPFASGGVSYLHAIGEHLEAGAGVEVGAVFAGSRDDIEATISTGGTAVPATVSGSDATARSAALFVMPELRLGARLGRVHLGVGVAAGVFILDGPSYATGDLRATGECVTAGSPECAQGSAAVTAERAYGQFVLWVPSLRAGFEL